MNYFSKYILVGLLNTLIGYLIIFSFMYILKMPPEISNFFGYAFGLILSYSLNRYFTFNSNQLKRKEFPRFLIIFCIAYTANLLMLLILIYGWAINDAAGQLIAGLIYVSTSFFMNQRYVFKKVYIE
jgi:putative flippase GtrA